MPDANDGVTQGEPDRTRVQPPAAVPSAVRQRLLGVPADLIGVAQALQFAIEVVATRVPRYVLFINAAKIVLARDDARLRDALDRADLVAIDGQSVVWGARLLGYRPAGRVTGIDYMMEVLSLANRYSWRVFFLGSTDIVLDDVEQVCGTRFPGLVVAGRHHGYFDSARDGEIADLVRQARPDVLFVGMTSPRKEYWLADCAARAGAPLAAAVGGSYEVLVGRVRRAPELWQRVGMEWLWRVLQEPRRLGRRYAQNGSRFLAILARELLWARRSRRASAQ